MPSSFQIPSDREGSVIQILEDAGFEVEAGNGPMVDWEVTWPDE